MVFFYNKHAHMTLVQKYRAEENYCVKKIEPSMLSDRKNQSLMFAVSNAQIASVAEMCRKAGCNDVSVLITDNGYLTDPIRIDVAKPRLDYLELGVSRVCNLHCRGCAGFIQLAEAEPPFYDLDAFVQDLKQLKTKFWGVERIRLMGGEPLLAKKIDAYVSRTRTVFPDADIRIVTNGLLIPTMSVETLKHLKRDGCSFDISNYPPTEQRKKEIISKLRKADISYDFTPVIRIFFKFFTEHPSENPKPAYDNCIFTHCHAMNQGGILSPCSFAYTIRRFNRHFGANYLETDFVDLYRTDKDGWQILEWMNNPHPFCCSCTAGMVPIIWRSGVHKDRAVESDWIIPKSVWTDHVIPFAQQLVKPAEKVLRSFMQRIKN